jgi:hypothetical protein
MTSTVLQYTEVMKRLVPSIKTAADWAPLAEFVAVDEFERVGVSTEVQGWEAYTEMLTRWASGTDSFETSVRRISEAPALVYYEVEERHHRGDHVQVVNSMTVFQFNPDGKIRHVDVYLQQSR